MLASRAGKLYNPPEVPPRPIEADYPHGAPADYLGNFTRDIEGRPLGAEFIAGRNVVGQGEKALAPAELDAIATLAIGSRPAAVARREIGGDSGRYVFDRLTGEPLQIRIARDLTPESADKTLGHEVSHVIDELSGQIPTSGLSDELKTVYNTLNNPNRSRNGTEDGDVKPPVAVEGASWGEVMPFSIASPEFPDAQISGKSV